MRRPVLLLAALSLAGLAVWALMPRPVAVEVAAIGRGDIEVAVEEEGTAEIRELFVVSAPLTGQLRRIDLHAGDPVTAGGTVVASIGPVPPALLDARQRAMAEASLAAAAAAVDLARAQVVQAEAMLAFRSDEATRAAALFDRAAIARHVLDAAILERATAAAALDSARANLVARERERDSAAAVLEAGEPSVPAACCVDLTAPVTGRIIRVLTEDDQVVTPGTPIVEIGDPADLRVRVALLSRDAVRVAPGAAARITGWGGPDIAATVERIEPSAETRVSALGIEEQRVEVLLALAGAAGDRAALGHGYSVVARITLLTRTGALSIPVGALFRDGLHWATYVVEGDRALLRTITLGERNDEMAEVLDGLQEGDLVVLHPSDLVADGVTVAPVGPPAPGP